MSVKDSCTQNEKEYKLIKTNALLLRMIRNWKWFLFSIGVMILLALVRIYLYTPTYSYKTSILIKDERKANTFFSISDLFVTMSAPKAKINYKNEITMLKSPMMLEEVVRRLSLDQHYYVKEKGLKKVELYENSPIQVNLNGAVLEQEKCAFVFQPLNQDKFRLTQFELQGKEIQTTVEGTYGTQLETPFGSISIKKTDQFSDSPIREQIYFVKDKMKLVVSHYFSRIEADMDSKEGSVIDLTIEDSSPKRAIDFLNTLVDLYDEKLMEDNVLDFGQTSLFIEERMKEVELELALIEQMNSSKFKSSQQEAEKVEELNHQLQILDYLQEGLKSGSLENQPDSVCAKINHEQIQNKLKLYREIETQRAQLLEQPKGNRRKIHELNQTLNSLKQSILFSINGYVKTINFQLTHILNSDSKNLTVENQQNITFSVAKHKQFKEDLYLFLLQKREENELMQTFTTQNIKIISIPTGSSMPVYPKKSMIFFVALLLGFFIPALILLIIHQLDHRVLSADQLTVAGVSLLAQIPQRKVARRKREKFYQEVVVNRYQDDPVNESFRVLRATLLDQLALLGSSQVVLVTSMEPKVGKSWVALNLAQSLSFGNAKVLLVDMHLRNPQLTMRYAPESKGVANYLAGEVTDSSSLVQSAIFDSKLDFLSAGFSDINSSELLWSQSLKQLIENLRKEYDYIVIEAPELLTYGDTRLIQEVVDFSLYVFKIGVSSQKRVCAMEDTLSPSSILEQGMVILEECGSKKLKNKTNK
ncbi:MAG TPA: Wzz/FepE/Etk N-terminal domain-containing protein [Bacteroidales bacterium]|nr:Wzz/FepE/Etk N-terminal domain-containing protein [Bacteroidales bacterium]HOH22646.1 Wzz/FepE/Etk N-terminal domain-containing protein [Bacteroidales bacterium]HPB57765.1 Wzz/FepE/Etk N-terminal domain-containing protein [Bacteroidales bacterium]HPZ03791.1 Wzz/FepE/Etk N-terminal domain-containing protein [Bacteroidales bacterium]HQB75317.1 Wzz/FepE/Etk N-terminal domain-containing protein [Bacteroidales bacterium]